MQNWKTLCRKLIFLPTWLALLSAVLCTMALLLVFAKGLEMSPIAYVVYVMSFYALVVIVVICWRKLPKYYRETKNKMHNNRYVDRYMTDAVYKSNVGLFCSLGVNIVYVVFNGISAYIYNSNWFGINALYYGIMAVMRWLLVRYVKKNGIGGNYMGELKRARICAYILLTVNLALSGGILMMAYLEKGFRYHGILIYVMALYTFYITIVAIRDMIKYRKYKSPVMSITKGIRMASALFSMLFLETAMLAQFGADTSEKFRRIMLMTTGAGISVIIVSIAIFMIVKTSKEIELVRSRDLNGK